MTISRRVGAIQALLLILMLPMSAKAVFLAVDLDPTTAGIQSSINVPLSSAFMVDIVVGDISPTAPLNGFDLQVTSPIGVLGVNAISSGSFLLPLALQIASQLAPGNSRLAEVTLGPIGAIGEGVLAQLSLEAITVGSHQVGFGPSQLSAPFGGTINIDDFFTATINVFSGPRQIPEPQIWLLLGVGLLGLRTFSGPRKAVLKRYLINGNN